MKNQTNSNIVLTIIICLVALLIIVAIILFLCNFCALLADIWKFSAFLIFLLLLFLAITYLGLMYFKEANSFKLKSSWMEKQDNKSNSNEKMRNEKIKILFMDVDGTLTDGKFYMGVQGEVMKAFYGKDGQGIVLLPQYGVTPVIITGKKEEEITKIINNRCIQLNINECDQHYGVQDKVELIKTFEEKYPPESFSYIGDDISDKSAMKYIKSKGGIIACPADAEDSIKSLADFICKRPGGGGAVRDFINYLIDNKLV